MSLKAKLTILYLSMLGTILLLFSIAVYISSSVTLVAQVDESLSQNAAELIRVARASSRGNVQSVSAVSLDFNVFAQIWGSDGQLKWSSSNLAGFTQPLDRLNYQHTSNVYRDVTLQDVNLRVLSIPLTLGGPRLETMQPLRPTQGLTLNVEGRQFGVLQVATDMALVNGTRRDLTFTLTLVSIVALIVAGTVGWMIAQNTLAPLQTVTETALQITETNDLSRRIPEVGSPNDEVGKLVRAFNLNLSNLERLITTQRQFLADVGHELRTPLTVIKGNVALMRRLGTPDEESLDSIKDEVERLTRLVGDLMLLAQAESGKLPLYVSPVELDDVIFEVFREVRVLAEDHVKLTIKEIDQIAVCGDRDRLKQVLINLVSNGIKYTPAGGRVLVSLGRKDRYATVSIEDNGPGIPAEDLPHIFERFYRAEKARKRSKDGKGGYGLGLSIAYWIVHLHEGDITVDSVIGKGTTFTVKIPLLDGDCQGKEPLYAG